MPVKETIVITLPNNVNQEVPKATTGSALVKMLSRSLAKETLAMEVNGEAKDLGTPLMEDARVVFLTWQDEVGKKIFWHSTAHLMAEALEALYPSIQLGIGPPIKQGFYYDVDFGNYHFDSKDLAKVEDKMRSLLQTKSAFTRIPISKKEALKHFASKNTYKTALIQELEDGDITFYQQGNFTDLCRGPHLPHTGFIKAFSLLNIAGAYWRGKEDGKQLTRIYGISFPKKSLLEAYVKMREEMQKRDHRQIGKALGMFTFSEKVGLGLPLWLPKGAFLREQLVAFLRKVQRKMGYQPVVSPHIGDKNLYITSGHYEKYQEGAFQPIATPQNKETFLLKPMNCPHHCVIYQAAPRSYKELPLRFAEFGTVYRYEQSGELHGLTRVRSFTQDDAHIFCRPDQLKQECLQVIRLVLDVLKKFHFSSYHVQLSLRDPNDLAKYIGEASLWDAAEQALKEVVAETGLQATTMAGEAAFYGPKIDFMVEDALGRAWQLGTVQIDYQLPVRFGLHYIGQDNHKHVPIIIHRAPFGSLERFIAILLEHTAGNLPVWLALEQVVVLPISTTFLPYAQQVVKELQKHEIRATLDGRDEKIGRKIRDAEMNKTPYMLLVGAKELANGNVAVRRHGDGDQGSMTLQAFIMCLRQEEG